MISNIRDGLSKRRILLLVILCILGLGVSQSKGKRTRKPRGDNRVYLNHADVLRYDQMINPEAQILNGHVSFRHNGATLTCDSAHFYEASNSFEAFGHVYMKQGDTLSLKSDYAFYDGNEQMAIARRNVLLVHRKTKLYTDSLNYDRLYNTGYFFEGGKLVDKENTLTSDWGEYNTETKMATFNYDVKLKNPKYFIDTDTIHYDVHTSVAHVRGPSWITSGESKIYTEEADYDSRNDRSELMGRSKITNKQRTIIGDSIFYDSKNKISRGYNNVIYTDEGNKNMFLGDYAMYNETTGYGEASRNAVAIDYSQKDTLWMHADSFKIYTYNINTDSVYRVVHAFNKVRAYRVDLQAVCDSLVFNSKDSCMTMYKDPITWNEGQQMLGDKIQLFTNDSTVRFAHVTGNAFSIQQLPDKEHYNQLSSKELMAFFTNGEIRMTEAVGNVLSLFYPQEEKDSSLILLNYNETDTMRMYFAPKRKLQKIWASKSTGNMYPLSQIPPNRRELPGFAWYDYVRPLNKDDIFQWRGKRRGDNDPLPPSVRRAAPLQTIPDSLKAKEVKKETLTDQNNEIPDSLSSAEGDKKIEGETPETAAPAVDPSVEEKQKSSEEKQEPQEESPQAEEQGKEGSDE